MPKATSFRFLFLLGAGLFSLAAQAERREFNFRNFDRLNLGNAFVIDVRQGTEFKVVADGAPRDLNNLVGGISRNTLKIRFKSSYLTPSRQRLRLLIVMPTLRGLDFTGASQSTVNGFNDLGVVDVLISGASKAKIAINAKKVNLNVSGASSVVLTGRATDVNGDVSGGSNLKGYDFEMTHADFELSGASMAQVLVTKALLADATGASRVSYRGGATIRASTSGASTVRSE
ncbi:MAG: DUF2807 domain-containing protein [Cytophagaceae bacterium]|nr:DUF2807 domain-containing protein [Cytophagaceae bacterium]